MTREQKIDLIERIQNYFKEYVEQNDINKFGYVIPAFEMKNIFSNVLFGKNSTKCTGFDKTIHRHYYVSNLTDEENILLNDEFRKIAQTDALTLTKSRRAVRISEDVMWYNNILY